MFSDAPAQHHRSIPFVSARARIAEFDRLREELRKTEVVRERQVERLNALAGEASYELDVPQVFSRPRSPYARADIWGVLLV